MTGYHTLVEAHGTLAAITFLLIVPASILMMRFYGRRPRSAVVFHIWLNILALLLSTVVIMLGAFAVGHKRSLTNPHHGIGVAIYVLMWFQLFGGWLVHRWERGRRYVHMPLKAMLHNWVGRAVALLGIVQVPLGLTLYGSPKYLFALFTLWATGLVVAYFTLEWLHERRRADYGNQGSVYSDEVVDETRPDHRHAGWGKLAAAGLAGVGLASLFRRRRSHDGSGEGTGTDVTGTGTESYLTEEKESEHGHHGWGRRLLEIGVIGAGVAAIKGFVDRRRHRDDASVSDAGPYRPPLGGNQAVVADSASRLEEGLPSPNRPMTPTGNPPGYVRPSHPLAQPPMTPGRPGTASSYSHDDFASASPSHRDRRHHTFRDAVAAGGVLFAARELFKGRKQRKEQRREDELRNRRLEEERVARMNSVGRYTGDGAVPAPPMSAGVSRTDVTGSFVDDGPRRSSISSAIPVAGVGAAAAAALADRNRIRPVGRDPVIAPPGPASAMPVDVPPPPPMHRESSSGSEVYTTGSGRQRHRHHLRDEAAAGLAGAAVGAAATEAARRHRGRNTDSMESQPVSLRVKMHNDGRHVTLRRLTEEEVAAQREAQQRGDGASGAGRPRNSSFDSGSGRDTSGDRQWRRTEALEAEQAAATDSSPAQLLNVPPPPPIPATSSGLDGAAGSITSPGTETSGPSEYAKNRRRRRAERAQARLARERRGGGGGNTVDFT